MEAKRKITQCHKSLSWSVKLAIFTYSRIDDDCNRTDARKTREGNNQLSYRDSAYLYFMYENGSSVEELEIRFQILRASVRHYLYCWARFIQSRAQAFGSYLTWQEYLQTTPTRWKKKYPNQRIHLWDTTDVRLAGKPSTGGIQSATHNSYYNGNVLHAAVGCTPFGWLMTVQLYPGALLDTDYLEVSGILSDQQQLALRDGGPPVGNMLDKGFKRAEDARQRYGNQYFIQPSFRRRATFTPVEVLRTTKVASERNISERAVLRPCSFGFVQKGIRNNVSPPFVDAVWENICFRCNFTYRTFELETMEEIRGSIPQEISK